MGAALVVVALLIIGVLVYAQSLPDQFLVQRRIVVNAGADRVFAEINDFQQWANWSPWDKYDPQMQKNISTPSRGVGAVYQWSGNNKVGQGRMEIKESLVNSRVTIQLDFSKPFEAHNQSQFDIKPQGAQTEVTWTMRGPNVFMGKVMQVFISMDKMVGKDFEAGLANLKAVVENTHA